jgi:hypothetical protein
MSDTETTANEIYHERAAIVEHDGLLTREQAEAQGLLESEQYREASEARDVVTRFYPSVPQLEAHFALVLIKRGKEATEKLKANCRVEWKRRKLA